MGPALALQVQMVLSKTKICRYVVLVSVHTMYVHVQKEACC